MPSTHRRSKQQNQEVSMLKNDALREVEKLKCSQNSNHLYVYDIIYIDILYVLIVYI